MNELAELFRNAIELNRYSNNVARRIIESYNDRVLDAIDELSVADGMSAVDQAKKLQEILQELKIELQAWGASSATLMIDELQELAAVQARFSEQELQRVVPEDEDEPVRRVPILAGFAAAVVLSDPTARGVVALSDNLEERVAGRTVSQLAAGGAVRLPNGEVVDKAFKRIATRQAELFGLTVRNGLLSGETIRQISQRLRGRLRKGQRGSIDRIIQAGGQMTSGANNQMRAIVRTSVTQIAVEVDRFIALANPLITNRYRYTAVLDSRTSARCRSLDGKIYEWGKGPLPPQHFNCRSRTRSIWRGETGRESEIRQDYGAWLNEQDEATKLDVLGPGRLKFWNRLVNRFGPDEAIRKFVAKDGSELTLEQLNLLYPNGSSAK
jgi:SPP1 gp7 family putative phage head morphogenesis protein|tara:strand:+ start:879 stop:2027 length:1149 start_codon:yes stop_codon:yes gene_type:complete